jgi:hypothetical protein
MVQVKRGRDRKRGARTKRVVAVDLPCEWEEEGELAFVLVRTNLDPENEQSAHCHFDDYLGG